MRTRNESLQVFRQDFSNFEIFSNVVRGYDLEILQLDRGPFKSSLQQILCGQVQISHFTAERRLEAFGNPPPGLWSFGIPTANCPPFIWRKQYSDGNTIQIYKTSTELAMVSSPYFEAIDVAIPEKELDALTHRWELPALDRIIGKREMAYCDPVKLGKLRGKLQIICDTLQHNPGLLQQSPSMRRRIQDEVPYLLLEALNSSALPAKRPGTTARNKALKSVIEYFQQMPNQTSTFAEFCDISGINERTLQRAFRDHYGVSPKAYAKALHLNRVYKTLLYSNHKETTISEVASNFGFWHMGQFANDYRRHFGELPSTTLHSR